MTAIEDFYDKRGLDFTLDTGILRKTDLGWDPLLKVSNFLSPIQSACARLYHLGPNVAVDESGIGYKGRGVTWTQFNPFKPNK